jgi:hypothetical protein
MKRTTPVKKTTTSSARPKNRVETATNIYSDEEFHRKVQEVAYRLYVARGCVHGYHVEDWEAAELIVRGS